MSNVNYEEQPHSDEYVYRRRSSRRRQFIPVDTVPPVEDETPKVLPFPQEERSFLGGFKNPFHFNFGIEELLIIGLILLLWTEEERDEMLIILLAFLLFV